MATQCFILALTVTALNVYPSEPLAFRSADTFTNRDLASKPGVVRYHAGQDIRSAALNPGKKDGGVRRFSVSDTAFDFVPRTSNKWSANEDQEKHQRITNTNSRSNDKSTKNSGVSEEDRDIHHALELKRQTSLPNAETKSKNKTRSKPYRSVHSEMRKMNGCRISGQIANCSSLGLTLVPKTLPADITDLILSNNKLTTDSFHRRPFQRYHKLLSLKMDNNRIASLPDMSFYGLNSLKYLDLYNNSIIMNDQLNQSKAFLPLAFSLQKLVLNRNNPRPCKTKLVYPDKALSYLSSLQSLEIDGLCNKTFGYHFRKMTNLTSLQMSGYITGYCDLSYLSNDTFDNVPSLTRLNVSDCMISQRKIGMSVLEPLVHLELLDVSYNFDLGIKGLGTMMYGQRRNQNLKYLYMNLIGDRYQPCIVVYAEDVRYFRDLHLEMIQAQGNGIEMIDAAAIKHLPTTLKTVDLRRNKVMMGAYWTQINRMTNLQTLLLDGYDEAYKLPMQIPQRFKCDPSPNIEIQNKNSPKAEKFLKLKFPPNLKTLSLRRYFLSYQITGLSADPNNKLQNLNMHGNYIPSLIGPVLGVDQLEILDLSSCNVKTVADGFFSNFKSLKTLNLFDNMLGDHIHANPNWSIFCSQTLESLNLGMNNIYTLAKGAMETCTSLRVLNLSKNSLNSLGFSTVKMGLLSYLNLSHNSLETIPQQVMDHFDIIIHSEPKARIDMSFNPISCDCRNIAFLEWIIRTKIFGDNYTNYKCFDSAQRTEKEIPSRYGYERELKVLKNQCADNSKLLFCVVAATLAFFIILIGVVIYRFRWTMRYWYHVGKLMFAHGANNDTRIEYDYDVFVCHCQHDKTFITEEVEVKLGDERGLKLLVPERCFQAGQRISDNILRAVQLCRKTLVVMTKSMLSSSRCDHELQMAKQEAISTGRNVLVFLFLEKIDLSSMDPDLSSYIRNNVFVVYPSNPAEMEAFWDKLAADINDTI